LNEKRKIHSNRIYLLQVRVCNKWCKWDLKKNLKSLIFYSNFIMFTTNVLMLAFIRYSIMAHTMTENEKAECLKKILSIFGIIFIILRELFQLLRPNASNINYFKSPLNNFEISFIILAFSSQLLKNTINFKKLRVLFAFTKLCVAFEFHHLVGELPFFIVILSYGYFAKSDILLSWNLWGEEGGFVFNSTDCICTELVWWWYWGERRWKWRNWWVFFESLLFLG